jgi:hypothetical protein
MVKQSVKTILVSSLILAIVACTKTPTNNVKLPNNDNFSDLDKEYTFTTKELTQAYLQRKLDKWLDTGNPNPVVKGHLLVKEIAYARYKHAPLFCSIVSEHPEKLEAMKIVTEVSERSAIDIPFGLFLDTCDTAPPGGTGEFQVNTYFSGQQDNPAVAMDSDGDFVVVWDSQLQDYSEYGIYAQKYFADGNRNGSEFIVNTTATGSQHTPRVAMDDAGDFVITWESNDQDGSLYGVYAQRYNADGSKPVINGSEFLVNNFTTNNQIHPDVAMDNNGNFVITWASSNQGDGDYDAIYARRYDSNGDPQSSEFKVNTFTDFVQFQPAIAMSGTGDFVIIWTSDSEDGDAFGIYGQRYNADGSKPVVNGTEFQINTYTPGTQLYPAVAMDDAGDFVATWAGPNDGGSDGVFAQRYDSNGDAQGTEFLVNTYTTDYQSQPAVSLETNGDFVISWQSNGQGSDSNGAGIFAQRYNADGSLPSVNGTEFMVNTYTTSTRGGSSIALDNDGDFVVVWHSYAGQDGDHYGIFGQRYNNNGDALDIPTPQP